MQLVERVPEEPWDERVDLLVTPDGVLDCVAARLGAGMGAAHSHE